MILNKYIELESGLKLFYRQAGDVKKPAILLLHGFPSSSVMFKELMTVLADQFYLIAPDYPGFGFSDFPEMEQFDYSFENISKCLQEFVDKIGLEKYFIYLHDYGSSIGLRMCLNHPKKILGIIVQNGNAYDEGLGAQWDETKDYWAHPTDEKKENVKAFLSREGTKMQYTSGLPEHLISRLSPDSWTLDWALMSRPGNVDMQFHLNCDYQNNIPMFAEFQAYFRRYQPPALVLWGKYDAFFSLEEAYCYQRDLRNSELHILEGGHMALQTNFDEVTDLIRKFCAMTNLT